MLPAETIAATNLAASWPCHQKCVGLFKQAFGAMLPAKNISVTSRGQPIKMQFQHSESAVLQKGTFRVRDCRIEGNFMRLP